ncbi:Alpha-1-syntrophin [Bagarius yarrelli]|uniref:Alpha-1-syntrophin n=1 Tax=Bagarius yarrelli TaxID=175774 RepID=A0A556VXQ0_BAGYA|nr:Alpha-1-syntrophin [Bagarius yarrelli]
MAAAAKAPKSGLLEVRLAAERWSRVLATLSADTLTLCPGEVSAEAAKSTPTPGGTMNGEPGHLSSPAVPDSISNVKRTVRVTKQDVGGLGISIKVKYIKEMSAFFKNASSGTPTLLDSPPPTPQKQVDLVMKETKTIPLKMCHVTRKQCPPDTEDRYFEVVSADRKQSAFLRAKDPAMAQSWYNAIQANCAALLSTIKDSLRALQPGMNITHVGWIIEQGSEKPILAVLTDRDLLMYSSLPESRESLNSPDKSHPLITTRLVHSGPGKSSSIQDSDLTFGLRLGTKHGVETHLFRVDTAKELSTWSHLLVEGCHTAAELIQEVTTENGFTLYTEEAGVRRHILLQQPFERLRMSSDDGVHMIFLDFGGPEAEIQLDLHACPKTIVFIIHSFLSAKVKRLGLLALHSPVSYQSKRSGMMSFSSNSVFKSFVVTVHSEMSTSIGAFVEPLPQSSGYEELVKAKFLRDLAEGKVDPNAVPELRWTADVALRVHCPRRSVA